MNEPRRAAPRPHERPVVEWPPAHPGAPHDRRVEELAEVACAFEARLALTLLGLVYADPTPDEEPRDPPG